MNAWRTVVALLLAGAVLWHGGHALAAVIAYDGFEAGGEFPGPGQYQTTPASTDGKDNNSIFNQGPALTGFNAGDAWTGDAGSFAGHVYYRAEGGGLGYTDSFANVLQTTPGQVNLFRSSAGTYNKDIGRSSNNSGAPPGTMYFSGLVQFQSGLHGRLRTQWGDKTSIGIGFDDSGNAEIGLGATGNVRGTSAGTFAAGTPHLLVGKIVEGGGGGINDAVTLYVNPTDLTSEAANTPALNNVSLGSSEYVGGNAGYALNSVYMAGEVSGVSSTLFDEFRVATTWNEVVPIVGWVPPPPPPEQTLDAVADAYVQGQSGGGTNHGGEDHLWIKSNLQNNDWHRKTYMRFDLSALGFDHETELQDATLKLNFIPSGAGSAPSGQAWEFELYGLSDGDPGEGWLESGINWNNAPANDTGNGFGLLGNATSLGTFERVGQGTGLLELTSDEISDFIRGSTADDLLTFILVRNTGGTSSSTNYVHAIASKENGSVTGPQLLLRQQQVAAVIPEPSTLAVWSLLAGLRIGMGWRRRRG